MRAFSYERPAGLAEAFGVLAAHPDGGARLLAGGTDLLIRLRDGTEHEATAVPANDGSVAIKLPVPAGSSR